MRDGWVLPVAIDPNAGRESVIGSRWRAREASGTPLDHVVVTGVFDLGEAGLEIVFTSVEFGPTSTASVESFAATYTRDDSNPSDSKSLESRLAEIEARA